MLKKVTSRLTEEKYIFLKNGDGIAEGIRQAVDLYSKKSTSHLEFYRTSTSGYAYFDILSKDLEEAMDRSEYLRKVLQSKEVLAGCSWFLKEIKQVN
jgi:hypothetical protein